MMKRPGKKARRVASATLMLVLTVSAAAGCGQTAQQTAATTAAVAETTPTTPTSAAGQQELVAEGRVIFVETCMKCHSVNGQGASGPGPDLTHESAPPPPGAQLTDYRQFYSAWLDDPKSYLPSATMPPYPLPLDQKQALIEYLMTLT